MRILLVHNFYQQPGGEDRVFQFENDLLKKNNHIVKKFIEHNDRIRNINKFQLAFETIWSFSSQKKFLQSLLKFRPDIVHFHNTFPLLSPSVYYATQKMKIPVIQTLHNYRIICPAATLYRDNKVCEDCTRKSILFSILYGCYHNSRTQSMVISSMLTFHRFLKTWKNKVDLYIALTNFAKEKFMNCGIPCEKIFVKPNFIDPDPGVKQNIGTYVLFVGRLSLEKGLKTLLLSFREIRNIELQVAGAGPLLEWSRYFVLKNRIKNINILGKLNAQDVLKHMKNAKFLVFPSEWYEGFPMTILEAFATGTPVIASNLGAMAEIVEDGRTGLLFKPGDPQDLAAKVQWAWEHPEEMARMGRNARQEYEQKYTAERNYEMLMEIYQKAMEMKRRERGRGRENGILG